MKERRELGPDRGGEKKSRLTRDHRTRILPVRLDFQPP